LLPDQAIRRRGRRSQSFSLIIAPGIEISFVEETSRNSKICSNTHQFLDCAWTWVLRISRNLTDFSIPHSHICNSSSSLMHRSQSTDLTEFFEYQTIRFNLTHLSHSADVVNLQSGFSLAFYLSELLFSTLKPQQIFTRNHHCRYSYFFNAFSHVSMVESSVSTFQSIHIIVSSGFLSVAFLLLHFFVYFFFRSASLFKTFVQRDDSPNIFFNLSQIFFPLQLRHILTFLWYEVDEFKFFKICLLLLQISIIALSQIPTKISLVVCDFWDLFVWYKAFTRAVTHHSASLNRTISHHSAAHSARPGSSTYEVLARQTPVCSEGKCHAAEFSSDTHLVAWLTY
jgi:hypothetical protein